MSKNTALRYQRQPGAPSSFNSEGTYMSNQSRKRPHENYRPKVDVSPTSSLESDTLDCLTRINDPFRTVPAPEVAAMALTVLEATGVPEVDTVVDQRTFTVLLKLMALAQLRNLEALLKSFCRNIGKTMKDVHASSVMQLCCEEIVRRSSKSKFKIPKLSAGHKLAREPPEEEEMMHCTQATMDDITYDVRYIPEGTVGMHYEEIFQDYLSESITKVIVEDAYIQLNHQIQNLIRFIEMLVNRTSLKEIHLITCVCPDPNRSLEQRRALEEIRSNLAHFRGIKFTYSFQRGLHDRVIEFNNGWSISLGRGLDYFHKSTDIIGKFDFSMRKTKSFRVITFKSPTF